MFEVITENTVLSNLLKQRTSLKWKQGWHLYASA